jgi:hypothetical protein
VRYKLTKRQTQEEVRVLLPWEELTDSFTRKAWCVVKLSLL